MRDPAEQLKILTKGVVDLQREEELLAKLREGRPLRVKAGFDPTRPDLHLGHTVLMEKMRQFQELGHEVIFVVGDFTAQIGDPSGRNADAAAADPRRDRGGRAHLRRAGVQDPGPGRDASRLQRELARGDGLRRRPRARGALHAGADDGARRLQEALRRPAAASGIHELLYPLAQGYDSVHLAADVELGGTDQLFNLLVGRELMRDYGQSPQVIDDDADPGGAERPLRGRPHRRRQDEQVARQLRRRRRAAPDPVRQADEHRRRADVPLHGAPDRRAGRHDPGRCARPRRAGRRTRRT